MAEGNGNGNGNGGSVEFKLGPFSYKGSGSTAIQFLVYIVLMALIGYNTYQHDVIGRGLNDVFIATIMTPQQKADLPGLIKEKLEEKVKQKAEKVVKDTSLTGGGQ